MVAYQSNSQKTVGEIQGHLSSNFRCLPWKGASAYVLNGRGRERKEVPPDYVPAPGETLYFKPGSC